MVRQKLLVNSSLDVINKVKKDGTSCLRTSLGRETRLCGDAYSIRGGELW